MQWEKMFIALIKVEIRVGQSVRNHRILGGVKAFNFVSVKATEVSKDDSTEVTTSDVARNYAGEMIPCHSQGLQRGTEGKLT